MNRSALLLMVFALAVTATIAADRPAQRREAYQSKVERELNDLSNRVEHLKTQSQNAGSRSRAELQRQVGNLESQLAVARGKLNELRQATTQQWAAFRRGLDAKVKELRRETRRTAADVEKSAKD